MCPAVLFNPHSLFIDQQCRRRRREIQTATIKDGLSDTTLITSGPIKTHSDTSMALFYLILVIVYDTDGTNFKKHKCSQI